MTPEQLKSAAVEMFGEIGWVTSLAERLKIDRTQIWRYVNSRLDVPGPVEAAVLCWLRRYRETGEAP